MCLPVAKVELNLCSMVWQWAHRLLAYAANNHLLPLLPLPCRLALVVSAAWQLHAKRTCLAFMP
jgi:hypothetical protein